MKYVPFNPARKSSWARKPQERKNCKTEASAEICNQSNCKFKRVGTAWHEHFTRKHFDSAASSFDAKKFIDSRGDRQLGRWLFNFAKNFKCLINWDFGSWEVPLNLTSKVDVIDLWSPNEYTSRWICNESSLSLLTLADLQFSEETAGEKISKRRRLQVNKTIHDLNTFYVNISFARFWNQLRVEWQWLFGIKSESGVAI